MWSKKHIGRLKGTYVTSELLHEHASCNRYT